MTRALELGQQHFERREWRAAYAELGRADREGILDLLGLEQRAVAAYLIGRDVESANAWSRAHQIHVARGDDLAAARCAFWLAFGLTNRGEFAQAGGWLSRARRHVERANADCPERGMILVPVAIEQLSSGNSPASLATFTEIGEIGERHGVADLIATSRLGCGHSMIRLGQVAQGVDMLDEAMVYVTADEVSPSLAGLLYCAVIEACHEIYDVRRARQWTKALSQWCESQPDIVPYRGECLVHRAQIMQADGDWPDALAHTREACEQLSNPPGQPSVGSAFYQRAEMLRLKGEFRGAEDAYRQASEWGRSPQPGLALLRLAQGQADAAESAIRRELLEIQDHARRCRLLPAVVDVMLGVGDIASARVAADELAEIAAEINVLPLHAAASQANGAVLFVEGRLRDALAALRRAWTIWNELTMPHDAARVRVLIGRCCRELGDEETARLELDAALRVFRSLGAHPDIDHAAALVGLSPARAAGGLTSREIEVIRLVAGGKTNRVIAAELFLSEKTVARHLSNIFLKLGVSSRAAATAFAFEHHLV